MPDPKHLQPPLRRSVVIGAHLTLWACAYVGAYMLRFDARFPQEEIRPAISGLGILRAPRAGSFWLSGLFHGMMRYAGINELWSIIRATTISSALFFGATMMVTPLRLPRSIYVGEWVLAIVFASSLRLAIRLVRERHRTQQGS